MTPVSKAGNAAETDILIVGAGHGGAQVATALRQGGFSGSITMLGDEPDLPYERPQLSKAYLSGTLTAEHLAIRPAAYWTDRNVAVLTGTRVTSLDPDAHLACCEDGQVFAYGQLVWATGGAARRLACPGHDLAGVHTVRTRADADRMRRDLATTRRAVIIGGGYIGLEVASVLVEAGQQVVVVELLDRVLARVAGEPLSRFFEAEHRARGVALRLGTAVTCIEERRGRVSGVRLEGGEVLPCELAVVGIGIVPAVRPLLMAGATGGNGVTVDAQCRTSLPDIFAIGDCALHENRFAGGAAIRIESVQNASDQASVVARVLTGVHAVYDAIPWFWSDQYDLKLQTIGLSLGHDRHVLRGDPVTRSFSVVYLKAGRVIALDCVNATRDYVQGKRLISEALAIPPELLADAKVPLKSMHGAALSA